VLGWSDSDFWNATPRKYNAVFWTHIEINKPPESKPKKGSDAIKDILGVVGRIKR
jgi:hypothetical protein